MGEEKNTLVVPDVEQINIDSILPPELNIPREIYDTYSWRCGVAYNRMFAELVELFDEVNLTHNYEILDGSRIKFNVTITDICARDNCSEDDESANAELVDLQHKFKVITGRCGAAIGAAKKFAQRTLALYFFSEAFKRYYIDLTPAVVNSACKELFGHGVDKKVLNNKFGIPGRTAADKSKCYTDDKQKELLGGVISDISTEKESFDSYSLAIRISNMKQFHEIWKKRKDIPK